MPETYEYDLAVIGGGPAGLTLCSQAAASGLKVLLAEKRPGPLGGDCVYTGCVPSKTLIKVAKVAWATRQAAAQGLNASLAAVDMSAVNARLALAVAAVAARHRREDFEERGVTVRLGEARFTGPHTLRVGERIYTARKFALATGSHPYVPPIPGLAEIGFVTNEGVFNLPRLPGSLAVIGGGAIGLELAQAFARLGSQVTVVEVYARVLHQEDREVSEVLQAVFSAEGIQVLASSRAIQARKTPRGKALLIRQGEKEHWIEADEILVATGRRPNTGRLDLARAGVDTSERGHLVLDSRLRTSARHIWACGDVAGPYNFAHMAEAQAGLVFQNAVLGMSRPAGNPLVPWAIFTDPELARVGLNELEAKRQGIPHESLHTDFAAVDRAQAEGRPVGFGRLLLKPDGSILGATLVGQDAGDLIQEIVLAMSRKLPISGLASCIHIYPTLSRVVWRLANSRPSGSGPRQRRRVQRMWKT